jgi:hypothetical protein
MSDLSAFDAKVKGGGGCLIGTALAELDNERAGQLRAALLSVKYSGRVISEVMTDWGRPVSRSVVGSHRRKECDCAR